SIVLAQPPDILIDGEAGAVAARAADGSYFVTGATHSNTFVTDTWTRRDASGPAQSWPEHARSADGRLDCSGAGCLYRANGRRVLLVPPGTLGSTDCAAVDLALITAPPSRGCAGAAILDRPTIRAAGGYAIWLKAAGISMVSARDWRGDRPWVPRPPGPPARLSTSAAGPPAVPAP
ncbi:MAG TPA: hypothetical protein VKU44_02450, partial [Terriglobia bacterium]|nr:hypothetical protein [Terriglobia bacterium]